VNFYPHFLHIFQILTKYFVENKNMIHSTVVIFVNIDSRQVKLVLRA